MAESIKAFGKWRARLWPVHNFELKKIIPLLLLKFFISLNYNLLANLKETLVVTADHSGAEVIAVLKGWIVLPIAILATLLYTKLTNVLKSTTLFYGSIGLFLFIVVGFAFFLYPNADVLSPHKSADFLTSLFGSQYSHWIAIYRNWIHTLFFVVAELWSTIVIFVLFWGLTNQINTVSEAKRTYTLFIAAGDIGGMLTGPVVAYFASTYFQFEQTLKAMSVSIALICLVIIWIVWWLNKNVVHDPNLCDQRQVEAGFKTKNKLSLWQSIRFILSSPHLLSIAMLVIGCGLSINLVEVSWKANLKLMFPSASEYQAFSANVASLVGLFALITVLLLSGNSLRIFGWHFSAQVTPIIIGSTGLIFFLISQNRDYLAPLTQLLGITPLALVVYFGAFQSIISKVVKYSFFDSTKEMVFIPLDQESKTKGKAAIDVVGSRLGKSGSSWIQVALFTLTGTGSVLSISSYLIPVIALTIIGWMSAVRFLDKKFTESQAPQPTPIPSSNATA